MSEEKPIFPRSDESSQEEKNEYRQKTKRNLEAEEQQFQVNNDTFEPRIICSRCRTESSAQAVFCCECGNFLNPPLRSSATASKPDLLGNPAPPFDDNLLDEQKYQRNYRVNDFESWLSVEQNLTQGFENERSLKYYFLSPHRVNRCLIYYLENLKEGQRANLSSWILMHNEKPRFIEILNEG